jgi:hypothetical protein
MFKIYWVVAALLAGGTLAAQSPPTTTESAAAREARIEALRAKAREHIEQERVLYSASQLQDIDARYRSAHQAAFRMLLRREAAPILLELVAAYPKSNRSGCAVLKLAQLASGAERENYFRQAIASHSNAWCESGVQVGALARAQLAVHHAGLGKFDEAERLAQQVLVLFPGAIDESGAPLDDVLEGIRLLRQGGSHRDRPSNRPLQPTSGAGGPG